MEKESWFKLVLLVVSLLVWNYLDLKYARTLDYEHFNYLIDSKSGQKLKPNELLDVVNLIEPTRDYVATTNAMVRLNQLEFNVNLLSALEADLDYSNAQELASSGWPVADQEQCRGQLEWIQQQLASNRNYSLLVGRLGLELSELMDCFGKPQAGLLTGVTTWPGLYDKCLQNSLADNQIRTRYCWAQMRSKWWPASQPVRPQARIRIGICLPETCDTSSLELNHQTIEWLIKLELNEFHRDSLELDSMFCLPDERSPMRKITFAGWLFIALVTSWISIVLVSSIFSTRIRMRLRVAAKRSNSSNGINSNRLVPSLRARSPTKRLRSKCREDVSTSGLTDFEPKSWYVLALRMLESVSISNSLQEFSGANKPPDQSCDRRRRRVDLRHLNAAKFLLALFIVFGHSYYLGNTFARSHQRKVLMASRETGNLIASFGRLVDTFFLLFGVFASYTLLRKVAPRVELVASGKVWLAYNVNILFRLAPVMLPVYWYTKLISVYARHGPWWDYGQGEHSLKAICLHEPWWKSIPHFGALGPLPGVACLPTAWFLVVYAQLSLLIPLIVFSLCKLPNEKLKLLLVLFVCCVSSWNVIGKMSHQSTFKDNTLGHFGALLVDLLEKFESLGTMATLGRAGSVLIGCYVGHLLRRYEIGEIGEWPSWLRSKLTSWLALGLNLTIFLLPIAGAKLTQKTQIETSLTLFVAIYLATCFLWSIANAILLVLAVTSLKQAHLLRLLAHPFWRSANKLGLAIYLVHWEVLYTLILGYEQGPSLGHELDIWKSFALGLLITLPLSFCIYILFEAPFNALVNLVQELGKTRPRGRELCKSDKEQIE